MTRSSHFEKGTHSADSILNKEIQYLERRANKIKSPKKENTHKKRNKALYDVIFFGAITTNVYAMSTLNR